MNIAIFASAFHPHVGGVEELCRQLALEYRQRGHGAIVITERWPRSLLEYEEFEGIPVHRIPFRRPIRTLKSKLMYLATTGLIRRRVRRLLTEFAADVIHVQCVSNNGFYASDAHRALGIPLVITLQGEFSMDAAQLYQRSEQARQTLRQVLREAGSITACSGQTLKEVEDFFGSDFGARGSVVYNGIAPGEVRDVTPYQHPRPYIFAAGRHVAQKGFDVLLRALKRAGSEAASHDLILAGDGTEHQALMSLAAELGLSDRVHFPGRVDHAKVLSLFAGSDLFVLPSRHEPFGIVNLEAMIMGKPVVASRAGGVPEIVTDGVEGILVPPENEGALADAILRLLRDDELRAKMGQAGQARAKSFFWPAIADQYMQVYEAAKLRSSNKK